MGSRIEGRAQTRWERTRDIDGSRLEGGIRTKLPKTSCAFLLHHEGGRLLSSDCVPIGAHLTHH